jgi:hypothetical protein
VKSRFEKEPSQVKVPKSEHLFFGLGRVMARAGRDKTAARCIREAKKYEKQADSYTGAQFVNRGRALLSAGQAYLNGRDPESAIRTLELAQDDLEVYSMRGTWEGFTNLSRLYQTLEGAYDSNGHIGKFEDMRSRAVGVAALMEEQFNVQTIFCPDNSRIITSLRPHPSTS